MNVNIYQLLLPFYYVFAFFIQKPNIKPLASVSVVVIIFMLAGLNPNFRDVLLPFLAFLTYFVIVFSHTRKVSNSVMLAAFSIINIFIANEVMLTIQFPTLWLTVLVTLALLTIVTFLWQRLLAYIYQLWESAESYLYLILIVIYFGLYYRKISITLNYFLIYRDAWVLAFQIFYLFFVSLFAVLLFLFNNSNEQIRIVEQEKAQAEMNQQYVQLMSQQYDEIRRFRHDYQNMLISLEGFIKAEEWQSLRHYFAEALGDYQSESNKTNRQLEKLVYIQNADLRNLLYTKLMTADSLGIVFNLEIAETIHINMPSAQALPRMLGIILDNAIEAASEITNGELSVAILNEAEEISVIIVNSCQATLPSLAQLKKKGFSTKGKQRGLGLYNLDQLVATTDVLLNTEMIDQSFRQELVIPKEVA